MAGTAHRIELTLDPLHASKLSDLARRTRTGERELVSRLLADVLDRTGPDGDQLTETLNAIPGASDRAEVSRRQAKRGEAVPLSEL